METTLKSLAETLIREPFAKMHRLAEKNLEEVGGTLEGFQETYEEIQENPGSDPELADVIPSFDKVKELYCLILLKMEEERLIADDFDSISSLAESGSKTVHSHKLEMEKPAELPTVVPNVEGHEEWNVEIPDFAEQISPERVDFFPEDLPPLEPVEGGSPAEAPATEAPRFLFNASSPAAVDYLRFAHWLDSTKPEKNFEENFLDRVIAQTVCFALESECFARLDSAIEKFWSNRLEAVRGILNPKGTRFELTPELTTTVNNLSTTHAEWLLDGHFSIGSLLNSLRYMAGSKSDHLEPSLLEMGTLLLFFGHEQLNGTPLKNYLNLTITSEDEVVEIALRLMRVQKLKTHAMNVAFEFTADHRTQLEQDVVRIHELLNKLVEAADQGRKVA